MRKKKGIIIISVFLCICVWVVGVYLLEVKKHNESKTNRLVTLEEAKQQFGTDMKALMEGNYENLIAKEFLASIDAVERLYAFQILQNQNFTTTDENIDAMIGAMKCFFGDTLDKSELYHYAYPLDENGEVLYDAGSVEFSYEEVVEQLKDTETVQYSFLGGFILGGEYYAHIDPAFSNVWFSKRTFGTSFPEGSPTYKEYLYISGIRQEDAVVQLADGEFSLRELEENVLAYVNGTDFPLPLHEEIHYQIGKVYLLKMDEGECVNFALRRVYEGVPFEYGSASASGIYCDEVAHDYTTISYGENNSPDTIMGFIGLQDKIDKKEEVKKLITAGEALRLLSESIGENSIYEVHGVELVYRNCEIPENQVLEVSDILTPKWKIITINQNDDKYTVFYVDVETGEITERFEYYYD